MPVVDGSGVVFGETDEAVEETDDVTGVEAAVPEVEVGAEDALPASMVKDESPV